MVVAVGYKHWLRGHHKPLVYLEDCGLGGNFGWEAQLGLLQTLHGPSSVRRDLHTTAIVSARKGLSHQLGNRRMLATLRAEVV